MNKRVTLSGLLQAAETIVFVVAYSALFLALAWGLSRVFVGLR